MTLAAVSSRRFTQPDTIIPNPDSGQSFNRYTYVNNNPIRYSDPTGHETCRYQGGKNICWSEAENVLGVRNREVCDRSLCDVASTNLAPPASTDLGPVSGLVVADEDGNLGLLGDIVPGTSDIPGIASDFAGAVTDQLIGQYLQWGDGWIRVNQAGRIKYYRGSARMNSFVRSMVGRTPQAGMIWLGNVNFARAGISRTFMLVAVVLYADQNLQQYSDQPLAAQVALAVGRTAAQTGGAYYGASGGIMAGGMVAAAVCGASVGAVAVMGVGGAYLGGEGGGLLFDLATDAAGG